MLRTLRLQNSVSVDNPHSALAMNRDAWMSGPRAVEGGLLARDIGYPGMALGYDLSPCDQAILDHRG